MNSISIIPPSFITSFVELKAISLYNHEGYDSKEEIDQFQQYLAISEFPDLEYLRIHKLSCDKELAMLIEKTNGNISKIFCAKKDKNDGMLIEAIANNCPKIKNLDIHLEHKDLVHLKLLLLNCKLLTRVRFRSYPYDMKENGDELLDILTKFSPNSLTTINISSYWEYSTNALENFYKSCRERNINAFI